MSEVEKVAAGLTEAQRRCLLSTSPVHFPSLMGGLRKLRLVEPVDRRRHDWTPLGLAVRKYLEQANGR
jgi:hypothetical protein